MNNDEKIVILRELLEIVEGCRGKSLDKKELQKVRSEINKRLSVVRSIVVEAGCHKTVTVTPPPLLGGHIVRGLDPFDMFFDGAYGLDMTQSVIDMTERAIGVLSSDKIEESQPPTGTSSFWDHLHPKVVELAHARFAAGHRADAVEAVLKHLNTRVKEIVKQKTNKELDGAPLMNIAFSPNSPIIVLADMSTQSGQDMQKGYMQIFAGTMTGIRNPKAHDNIDIDENRAMHHLFLASLLLKVIDDSL